MLERDPATSAQPSSDQPFSERIARLARAPVAVAYFYEIPDNSTFRYRVGNMTATLNAATKDSGVAAAHFAGTEVDQLLQRADVVDILVICRARMSHRLGRLIAAMRARRVPVLYDVDDLVFDPDLAPLLMDTLAVDRESDEVVNYWFSYCARIGAAMRLCDAALVTSEALGREVARASRLPYLVLPNFLNRAQLDASEQIWGQKLQGDFRGDGTWHLGYFSGSPSHNRDFGIAAAALARLLREDPRVALRLVGFLAPPSELLPFGPRVEQLPLQDTVPLQWLIGEVNLSLAPLQDNAFTACKSDLKWFEAAAAGTVTVASPAGGVGARIRDRVNGRLARSYEWYPVLRELIDDAPACRGLAERARAEALAECAPESQLPRIREALLSVTAGGAGLG